jgi:hypothetical protein
MNAWLERLDRALGRALDWGAWLVLPVVTLLFLQWPLRDLVHGYSREANDLGQWLFALYVAMAVTVATRAHTHLAADLIARGIFATPARNRGARRRADRHRSVGAVRALRGARERSPIRSRASNPFPIRSIRATS